MSGSVGILNVGAGDTKLTFDKTNPAECIRAGRIVTDMLRRGYALMVEIEQDGNKIFRRATAFDENTCEYIIADFDPTHRTDPKDVHEPTGETPAESTAAAPDEGAATESRKARPRLKTRRVAASETRSVAVARSAGG